MIEPIRKSLKYSNIAFYPSYFGVDLLFKSKAKMGAKSKREIENFNERILNLLGENFFGNENANFIQSIQNLMVKNNLSLSVAESCTGGLLMKRLTDISGASEYVKGGIIAYSDEIKRDVLGVDEDTLRKFGAVSIQTAKQLAVNVRKNFQTDIGLSITGIAGPKGGTKEKPVGLVCFGFATKNSVKTYQEIFNGDRDKIRNKATQKILDILRLYLGQKIFFKQGSMLPCSDRQRGRNDN